MHLEKFNLYEDILNTEVFIMNEELLLTFLAAAHEGSFTKAAKLRSYSVPSVMSQINELENYLGVSLFSVQTEE